jgi:hypothetical protein
VEIESGAVIKTAGTVALTAVATFQGRGFSMDNFIQKQIIALYTESGMDTPGRSPREKRD